jgi:hypothetical protein
MLYTHNKQFKDLSHQSLMVEPETVLQTLVDYPSRFHCILVKFIGDRGLRDSHIHTLLQMYKVTTLDILIS